MVESCWFGSCCIVVWLWDQVVVDFRRHDTIVVGNVECFCIVRGKRKTDVLFVSSGQSQQGCR